jgi:hypothetical protein
VYPKHRVTLGCHILFPVSERFPVSGYSLLFTRRASDRAQPVVDDFLILNERTNALWTLFVVIVWCWLLNAER